MKIYLLLILFSFTSLSQAANYKIVRGRLHTGGSVQSNTMINPTQNDQLIVNINYEILAKPFVPVPKEQLKGKYQQILPESFVSEDAYIQIEKEGPLKIDEATVYHLGRVTIGRYTNAHKIRIDPDNKKSEIIAIYHPQVSDVGWVRVYLTVKKIPLIGDYTLEAQLAE
jgi:hypothetical protein